VTPNPDFRVTTFFEVEYPKAHLKEKVTIAQKEICIPNIWNGTMFGDLD